MRMTTTKTENTPGSTANTAINLACGNAANGPNAYIPAALNNLCISNNVTTIRVGASYDKFPQIKMSILRQMRRYVAGATGDFNVEFVDNHRDLPDFLNNAADSFGRARA